MHQHTVQLTSTYDLWLVALAYMIAVLTAYTTLELANRIAATRSWARAAWLICGALVMGFGVWGMHFTGVLAFGLPRPLNYGSPQIVLSLVLAVAGAGVALYAFRRPEPTRHALWFSALAMGLGISGMHYLGMIALSADLQLTYEPVMVLLSLAFAVSAAAGAFWLAFRSRRCQPRSPRWFGLKLASALLLGVAIVGMHHLGMGAVHGAPDAAPLTTAVVGSETASIGGLVGLVTLVSLLLTLSIALVDRKIATQAGSFDSLFLHHPDAVYALSLTGTIQHVNPAAAALSGHAAAALRGTPFADLIGVAERTTLLTALRLAQSGATQHNRLTLIHQDGRALLVQLTHVPIVVGHEVIGLYGFGHDVTAQTQIEADRTRLAVALEAERAQLAERVTERTTELQAANAQLELADRLKDAFLAGISHELRTPLHAVLGQTELLQDEVYGALTPQQQRALTNVADSGQHLLTLINDILDLSQLEAGQVALDLGPVDLRQICEAHLRLIAPDAAQRQIAIERCYQETGLLITADARRLRQVLLNLLSNAVKFTPDSGKIGVELRRTVGAIQLVVWDSGIGIAPSDIGRLFRPFVQLDGSLSRRYGGTGLGLALAARSVALHGGLIAVESAPGHGSRFIVTLPDPAVYQDNSARLVTTQR